MARIMAVQENLGAPIFGCVQVGDTVWVVIDDERWPECDNIIAALELASTPEPLTASPLAR